MNLDLEITNYKISDLESFFKLPPNYTEEIVKEREEAIRSQILKSDELSKDNKNNITTFLNKARQVLINKQAPVIKHEDPPIIHTKHEEFIPSELNPLEKRTTTKTLCIDTLFRENYSKTKSTDYIYKLPVYINNIVSIQLTSFEFPNMINLFSSENNSNTFEIGLYNVNTGEYDSEGNQVLSDASYVITIPDGNYMSNTFQTILNNIFQSTDSIGLKFLKAEVGLQTNTIIRANNLDIDTIGSFAYDLSDNFYSPDFYFKLNFAIENKPLYKTAGWMMGFRQETYTVTQAEYYVSLIDALLPIVYEGYLSSESSYGSTMDNYIFVEIDDYHNNFPTNTFVSTNTNSYIGKNILARVVLTSGANTIIMDNASDGIFKKREYFGPIKLEKFRIRILNRFGDVIQLKQNDYSFVLELKQLY
jgi:hypothetical protein